LVHRGERVKGRREIPLPWGGGSRGVRRPPVQRGVGLASPHHLSTVQNSLFVGKEGRGKETSTDGRTTHSRRGKKLGGREEKIVYLKKTRKGKGFLNLPIQKRV